MSAPSADVLASNLARSANRAVDPAPARGWTGVAYEVVMVALAVAVLALLAQPDHGWVRIVNLIIWAIFVVDYFARLALSGDRRQFVRTNAVDLVAILPADFFRAARALRVVRLLRLLRAASVLVRVSATLRGVLGTNALGWILAAAGLVVLLGAGTVMLAEPNVDNLGDAVWWAIVTATTVGYGDIAPVSLAGRTVAVVLMIVGIGTLGMITGTIATYFLHGSDSREDAHIAYLKAVLDRWDELTSEEHRAAASLLHAMSVGGNAGDHQSIAQSDGTRATPSVAAQPTTSGRARSTGDPCRICQHEPDQVH